MRFDEKPAVDEEAWGRHAEATQFGKGALGEDRVFDTGGAYGDRETGLTRQHAEPVVQPGRGTRGDIACVNMRRARCRWR